ncbi:MAG: hypothetical protein M3Z21_05860, partial [Pseudomonadota bacterium]|nr:hypothetical protein [Pseudomonadota bacterium]
MTAMIVILSLPLAALLGFAAHRATLCTVRAVAEVLDERRPRLLLSFARAGLWALAVAGLLLWLWPERAVAEQGHALT